MGRRRTRRLKEKEDHDETGLAPKRNLSVLVPALLLRSQGDFQQASLGWGSLHFSMPNNKTDLLSADLLRSAAAAKNHTSARYLFSFI